MKVKRFWSIFHYLMLNVSLHNFMSIIKFMRWPWKQTHFSYGKHDVKNICLGLMSILIKTEAFQWEVAFDPAEDDRASSQWSTEDPELFEFSVNTSQFSFQRIPDTLRNNLLRLKPVQSYYHSRTSQPKTRLLQTFFSIHTFFSSSYTFSNILINEHFSPKD